MAIQIKLKNSVVQDSTPSTSDLPAVGEIALNANINSIGGFMRASDNTIVKIFGPGSLSTPTATTTVSGISELATNAETTTGTATNRVVTPAGLNAVTVAERATSNTNYVAKAGSTMTGVLQLTAGSTSAPAINFGASNTGIYQASGANNIRIAVDGSDVISASTAGGVNFVPKATALTSLTLGSQSATNKPLFFADANSVESASLLLDNSSNEFRVRNNRFSGKIVFAPSSNVEKARIDNGGKLLVGTSTARTNFFNLASTHTPRLQIESTNNDNGRAALGLIYGKANASGPYIVMAKHRSDTVGDNTVVQSGDETGIIAFQGADGSQFVDAARIQGFVDGTPGADDMPGRLEFSTTADGAASPTTRLTIDSAGLVKLPDNGKFVAGAGNDLQIYHDGSNSYIKDDGTGAVILQTNKLEIKNTAAGEDLAKFTQNAAVELYYDNVKKFETLADGVLVTGKVAATGDLALTSSDGQKIRIGVSNDLEILHNGTNTFLDNNTGDIYFRNTATNGDCIIQAGAGGHIYLRPNTGENGVIAYTNGAVELYYDNSKKLETTSTGISITGNIVGSNHLELGDGKEVRLGASQDFQIYHDGTFNYLESHNDREIHVNAFTGGAAENMAKFKPNGAVELYHNNSKKLETTSAGATVTGTLTATSFSGDGSNLTGVSSVGGNTGVKFNDDVNITLGTGNDTLIRHIAGSHTEINHVGTGDLILETVNGGDDIMLDSNDDIFLNHAGESMVVCRSDAQVELYYDNSKKFQTSSEGVDVVSGHLTITDNYKARFGASLDLNIYHDGSKSVIADTGTGGLFIAGSSISLTNPGISETMLYAVPDGAVNLYYDNSKKLETISNGVQVTGRYAFNGSNYIDCNTTANTMEFFAGGSQIGEFNSNAFTFLDSKEARFGNGNDLKIYHDGSNSYIRENGTGSLYIDSNGNGVILRGVQGEDSVVCNANGDVELYHDNSKKFETHSNGTKVSGVLGVGHDPQSAHNSTYVVQGKASSQCLFIAFRSEDGTNLSTNGMFMGLDGNYHYLLGRENRPLRLGANSTLSTEIDTSGHLRPTADNTYDLGATSRRWRNIYTNDLNLSNEGHGNDVDGTWGSYTIQEGAEDLFLINKRSGKKYKFNLTEVS